MTQIDHNVSPESKAGKEWLLKAAKSVLHEYSSRNVNMFYNAAHKYRIQKSYALGKQDTTKYKKPYVDEKDQTFTEIDWSIRPIVKKFRDIIISKILQRQPGVVATPIDALAKNDGDKHFANIKAKILIREQLKKMNPELLESPVLMKEPGEPEDMEELEIQMNHGWRHNMAMEAEMAFELAAYQNNFPEERKICVTNWFDHGVAGYKEYVENNRVKMKAINVSNFVTTFCQYADFRDMEAAGEIILVSRSELATKGFTKEQVDEIMSTSCSVSNFHTATRHHVTNKDFVEVFDMVIISTDETVYENGRKNGNPVVRKTKNKNKYDDSKVTSTDNEDEEEDRYIPKKERNVYRVKYIVGTDYCYDYGKANYQKISNTDPNDTTLPYHIYAYNFHEMNCQGIMEALIPVIDEYQSTIFKIQNFKNKWIAYIINIDLDALEGVALGKGGQNMTPRELLDMMFQTNIMLGRKRDISQTNPNYKAVEIQRTQMAEEFAMLVNDLGRLLQEMNDVSGLNELTNGSTPNPKLLTTPAQMGYEATANSLYPVVDADRKTTESLAKGVIQRQQSLIRSGRNVEGVVQSLGENTVKFVKVSPKLTMHDIGIMIQDRPTDQERQMLLEYLNIKDANNLIEPEDRILIMNTNNLKQAGQIIAHRLKKRKEKAFEEQKQLVQENAKASSEAGIRVEQEKQKTIQIQHQANMELENVKGQWQLQIAQLKVEGQGIASEQAAGAKIAGQTIQQFGREREKKIEQGIPVDDEDLSGMMDPGMGQEPAPDDQLVPPDEAAEGQMLEEQPVM